MMPKTRIPRALGLIKMNTVIRYPGFPSRFTFKSGEATLAISVEKAAIGTSSSAASIDGHSVKLSDEMVAFVLSPDLAKDPINEGHQLTNWKTYADLKDCLPDGFAVEIVPGDRAFWEDTLAALKATKGVTVTEE